MWFLFPDRSTEYLRLEGTHKNQANSLPKPNHVAQIIIQMCFELGKA